MSTRMAGRSVAFDIVSGGSLYEAADAAICRSFTDPFPCGKVELIIAMDDPCSSMVFANFAQKAELHYKVCETRFEFREALKKARLEHPAKPLAIVLGEKAWLQEVQHTSEARSPYLIDATCCGVYKCGHEELTASAEFGAFKRAMLNCELYFTSAKHRRRPLKPCLKHWG
ncbi:unnamed protein product [Cladocopium goreaui]|uniref:Uncharacterized protein n=1 Tax=Cladocopium goreaui TaxID=2562237 RepID=A0A9P1D2Z2_9DINO|nr:unnamed protein product [Cladocopium goreaui]